MDRRTDNLRTAVVLYRPLEQHARSVCVAAEQQEENRLYYCFKFFIINLLVAGLLKKAKNEENGHPSRTFVE